MEVVLSDQDRRIAETVARERGRLRNFIRSRVPDPGDAEDILQEVFYELVAAYRAMLPLDQVTGWLYQVARNRIIDLFRKKKPEPLDDLGIEDLLPSADGGPEAAYARSVLLDELDAALDELPPEQREVFVAHEFQGRSFKEMAAESGVSINTLLSRKRYAVLHLRERLPERQFLPPEERRKQPVPQQLHRGAADEYEQGDRHDAHRNQKDPFPSHNALLMCPGRRRSLAAARAGGAPRIACVTAAC